MWILLTLLLRRCLETDLILSMLTPVFSRLLTLLLISDFAGGRLGEFLVDRFRLFETHDR